jgi:hypothetical protein
MTVRRFLVGILKERDCVEDIDIDYRFLYKGMLTFNAGIKSLLPTLPAEIFYWGF